MENERPCVNCGQLIGPDTIICPVCHADQLAFPPPPPPSETPAWTYRDTWRIGFGLWLNGFILAIGFFVASFVLGMMMGGDTAAAPESSPFDLGEPRSTLGTMAAANPGKFLWALLVSAIVGAPFFAWSVGNSFRLIGDALFRRRGHAMIQVQQSELPSGNP